MKAHKFRTYKKLRNSFTKSIMNHFNKIPNSLVYTSVHNALTRPPAVLTLKMPNRDRM